MRLLGTKLGSISTGRGLGDSLYDTAAAVPSLDLRFAENKSLVDAISGQDLITFTRTSSGTYFDSAGVLRTATTNLLLRSEEFDNASWTKSATSVTQNDATAPSGALTADKVAEDTSTGQHTIGSSAVSWAGNTQYTFTLYAKAAGRNTFDLLLGTAGNWVDARRTAVFNVATGTVEVVDASPAVASIQAVGNGWYRCRLTATTTASPSASSAFVRIYERTTTTGGTGSYTGDGTSGIYIWGAQLEAGAFPTSYIPTTSTINSAPRFDHNPTTGESLGLLVEEQRTNGIRNNTMVGAVAGTPGTLPTNWNIGLAGGLSSTVVGVGTESGIPYIDLRIFGTQTSTQSTVRFDGATYAVAEGQTHTLSAWLALKAGSFPSGSVVLSCNIYNSSVTYLGDAITNPSLRNQISGTLTRFSATGTITGYPTAALARPYIYFLGNVNEAVDFTIRIGLPQLEQGAFATSVIPTSGAAATRNADVASITGANFTKWFLSSNLSTFYVQAIKSQANSINGCFFSGSNVSLNAIAGGNISFDGNGTRVRVQSRHGAVRGDTASTAALVTPGTLIKACLCTSEDSFGAAFNGTILTSTASPSQVNWDNALAIGHFPNGGYLSAVNGTISRLTYWPSRLSNSTLQSLTQ